MLSVLRSWRRKRLLAQRFPAAWQEHIEANLRHYQHLGGRQQEAVRKVVRVFLAEKDWTGGGGFAVSEEMKLTIAAHASLLVLGFDEPYYFDRVQSIIVYPGPYRHPPQMQSHELIVRDDVPVAGESWHRGAIVLSWRDVQEAARGRGRGHNVVVHEFAHVVDGLDGAVDGIPPLSNRKQERDWARVTENEYRQLENSIRRGEATLLDEYGLTNRAEFFAVASECFFERPRALRQLHPSLYSVLEDLYQQNPAQWLPDG